MASFDYSASADLYPGRGKPRKSPLAYRRFDNAAEAVRFAMEELSPAQLHSTMLEVDEKRFRAPDIDALYRSESFPLPRAVDVQ